MIFALGLAVAGVDHLRHTHDPARNAFSMGQPLHGADFADDIRDQIAFARRNLTRLQRASKGAGQSATGGGDQVV